MAALVVPTHRTPPGIYRAARALRWVAVILLVLALIFVATVAYSAYETAHATVESRSLSGVSVANGEIDISGSFSLTNPGIYPIQSLTFTAHVANDSGVPLTSAAVGPQTINAGSTGQFPITLLVPVNESGAAQSLLFKDQYLEIAAWANVTYAYFFPLAVTLTESRSWGAPFEGFTASAGTPTFSDGVVSAPVTIDWANHASFTEQGALTYTVDSASRVVCGSGSFPVNVPAGQPFNETEPVALSASCSPIGGEVLVGYTFDGSTTQFPPEPIP